MKSAIVAAVLASLVAFPTARADRSNPSEPSVDFRDLHRCTLRAVHAADNDIRLDQDARPKPVAAALPPVVARAILDHVTKVAKKNFTPDEWREQQMSCADIFSPVFRVDGPAGAALFVAPRAFPLGNEVDYFFMYDPRIGAVTRDPPLIYTKWATAFRKSDPLIKAPNVRLLPARGGNPALLIVEERTHNGNVYDAVVYRYFEVGRDMSLTQILAVEARAILLSDSDEFTTRRATFLSSRRVRVDVASKSRRKIGASGTVWLERKVGQPFHVVRLVPTGGGSGQGLLTYCESAKSDDTFLRVGCDFYY